MRWPGGSLSVESGGSCLDSEVTGSQGAENGAAYYPSATKGSLGNVHGSKEERLV